MENRDILNKVYKGSSLAVVILSAVLLRIIPHAPNFAPIGGLALFSGAHFNKKGFIIPLSAMMISDLIIGLHPTIIYVYISFLLISLLGTLLKTASPARILFIASLLSSVLFYLITNFGVWQTGAMYTKTFDGLIQSYSMGIPFFRNTLLADLIYTFVFFYGYSFIQNNIKVVFKKIQRYSW